MHFLKNLVVCSSAGPKILPFGSHCSENFQPILDCFIPNFKLKYEDSENIKADRVSTVVFNLHQIKRRGFLGEPGKYKESTAIPVVARRHSFLVKVQMTFFIAEIERAAKTSKITVYCFLISFLVPK